MRTFSSKRVYTFFVRTLVILLERYLVLHIIMCKDITISILVQLLFEEGRCHSRVVLLIASTVTDYSMLTPSDQLTN